MKRSEANGEPIAPAPVAAALRRPAWAGRADGRWLVVAAVAATLFVLVALDVHFDGLIAEWDRDVGQAVREGLPSEWRQQVGLDVLSVPGDGPVLVVVGGLAFILAAKWGQERAGAYVVASGLGLGAIVWVLKRFVDRPRPFDVYGSTGGPPDPTATEMAMSASFPSGHTTTTFVVYALVFGLVLYTYARRPSARGPPTAAASFGDRRLAFAAIGLWLVLVVTVALGRILGGVHWPGDILASWLLGSAWLALTWYGWLRWGESGHPNA